MVDPMSVLKKHTPTYTDLPTAVPDIYYQKSGDVGDRTLWYTHQSDSLFV